MPQELSDLTALILATGALGTSAFGIVEALKWTRIGLAGFRRIETTLGSPIMEALGSAYGSDTIALLRALYRQDRESGDLERTLRQGVRIGLRARSADALAGAIGGAVDAAALREAVEKLERSQDLADGDRSVIGRFELAVDARVDAALALSQHAYVGAIRVLASLVAIGLAATAALVLEVELGKGLLIGVAAVPVAPIAKDLVSGLGSAGRALSAAKKG